jgi:hypothetical protein
MYEDYEFREKVREYIANNLSIRIKREVEYYSYPSLTVEVTLEGQQIAYDSCTIYDGERG